MYQCSMKDFQICNIHKKQTGLKHAPEMKEKLCFAFQNTQCFKVCFKCFDYKKIKHIAMGKIGENL